MPHVYLEYTAGVADEVDFKSACQRLHRTLVEVSGLRLDLVKTRLVSYDHAFVGDCDERQHFVHLNVSTVTGKAGDDEQRRAISTALLGLAPKLKGLKVRGGPNKLFVAYDNAASVPPAIPREHAAFTMLAH